ncbi:hypothetical protein [Aeromicrobium sp. Root472D3]|uniref:hypothetical protein n=1 Tax=Aeromicrobium sp. Root472D3 TaxID=1736540 RepID=UPI0006FCD6A1|nr:hypothetical protein [Aeromicrobium sp. Root472D3]KQX74501.1 hypothetical protein ASD10_04500 [Aeromicrobium sp. Root472D3]
MRDRPFNFHQVRHRSQMPGRSHDAAAERRQAQPKFDLSVFGQDRWWVDADGVTFAISSLHIDDRRDLAAWLYRHATYFHTQVMFLEVSEAFRNDRGVMPASVTQTAKVWLAGTPLMRALEEDT